jgi:hydrogenase maturation protease
LLDLVDGVESVIVVDALVGPPQGPIHVLDLEAVSCESPAAVSSHGFGAGQALALAREVLARPPREVKFVAVAIDAPRRYSTGLSPAIRDAVPRVVEAVLDLTSRDGC